jgi:hypothetical protein
LAARGRTAVRSLAIPILALALSSCRAESPLASTEPPNPITAPEDELFELCSLDDNPSLLGHETIEVGFERIEQELIVVPVQVQPQLEVETRWIAGGGWDDEGRLRWHPPRFETTASERVSSRAAVTIRHHEDGSLELSMAPAAYRFHGHSASAKIERRDGDLVATLRGALYQDYAPFIWPWKWIKGELRMSADHWSAGDELSFFLEVASVRGARICGELRVVVPARGELAQLVWPREELD